MARDQHEKRLGARVRVRAINFTRRKFFKKKLDARHMDTLDVFALIVLLVLAATIIGGALFLGYLPGRVAKDRSHPQADAIAVCGWIGLLTGGLLLPVAFVWAYLNVPVDPNSPVASSEQADSDKQAEQVESDS